MRGREIDLRASHVTRDDGGNSRNLCSIVVDIYILRVPLETKIG
jgi:hypothetical protein